MTNIKGLRIDVTVNVSVKADSLAENRDHYKWSEHTVLDRKDRTDSFTTEGLDISITAGVKVAADEVHDLSSKEVKSLVGTSLTEQISAQLEEEREKLFSHEEFEREYRENEEFIQKCQDEINSSDSEKDDDELY